MPKLTDSQLVILATAAERPDGTVLPLAKSLKLNKGAVAAVLKSLVKRGLLAERPATKGDAAWSQAEDQPMALAITGAGREAIGVESQAHSDDAHEQATPRSKPPRKPKKTRATGLVKKTPAVRAGTKQAKLVALLKRKRGATIAEARAETGWQAHSVRGAISGALKKKLGFAVTSEVEGDRGRVYRITEKA